MDLQDLLEKIRQNDPATIRKIYKAVKKTGQIYVIKKGGNVNEAEEVIQEAMYRFYEKIRMDKLYTLTTQPEGAIFGFVRYIWQERIRERKAKQKEVSLDEQTYAAERMVGTEENEIEIISIPPENPIIKLMDQLGKDCKEILIAFYVHKLKLKELAIELGSSEGYLKVKKHRCMAQLRAMR